MANNLELSLRIKALVEGLKNVESLTDEVEALARETNKGLKDPTPQLTDGSRRAADQVEKLRNRVVQLAAALGAGAIAKSFINTANQAEQFAIRLETIEGSAEKAENSLDWVKEFAKTTPYELAEVTDAFIKLKAYGIDPTDGSLTTLGDTASAMGKSVNQAVEALADAMTGEFERLRDFGIKASTEGDKVIFRYRQNGQEMAKEADKNSGMMIKSTLEAIWNDRYAGGMAKFQQSWAGMSSNLDDMWSEFQRQVMDAGVFDALKAQMDGLLATINEAAENGDLQRWANDVGEAVTALIEGIASLTKFMVENKDVLLELVKVYGAYKVISSGMVQGTLAFASSLTKVSASANVAQASMARMNAVMKRAGYAAIAVSLYEIGDAVLTAADAWEKSAESMRENRNDLTKIQAAQEKLLVRYSETSGVALRTVEDFNVALDEQRIVWDATIQSYVSADQALSKLAESTIAASEPASEQAEAMGRTAAAAREMADAFLATTESGDEADAAIRELIDGIDLFDVEKVSSMAQAMAILKEESSETAEAVKTQLVAAVAELDPAQLAEFATALKTAFDQGSLGSQQLAEMNTAVLKASFEQLGLSASVSLGEISDSAQGAIASLDAIRVTLEKAGAEAGTKMSALGDAITAALSNADTVAAVEALEERILDMGNTGELAGKQLEMALKAARVKTNELTPGIQSVEEAYKQLGITSRVELAKVAEASRQAYEVIRNAGEPVNAQKAAWQAYAKAAIAANDGAASSALKTEAAALGLTEQLNKLTEVQNSASAATDSANSSLSKQEAQAESTSASLEKLSRRAKDAAKAQKELESGGVRSGGTVTDMDQAYGNFMQNRVPVFMSGGAGEPWYLNALREWNAMSEDEKAQWMTAQEVLTKPIGRPSRNVTVGQMMDAEGRSGGTAAGAMGTAASTGGVTQPVRTVQVRMNVGGTPRAFEVLEGQETTVEGMLRDLEKSMSSSQ